MLKQLGLDLHSILLQLTILIVVTAGIVYAAIVILKRWIRSEAERAVRNTENHRDDE